MVYFLIMFCGYIIFLFLFYCDNSLGIFWNGKIRRFVNRFVTFFILFIVKLVVLTVVESEEYRILRKIY